MSGLLFGWDDAERAEFGFHAKTDRPQTKSLVTFDGDEPVCIIAPTGAAVDGEV